MHIEHTQQQPAEHCRVSDDDRFLRRPEVEKMTGCSRSTIYALPDFPAPIRLSRRHVVWPRSQVLAWMRAQAARAAA